MSAAETVMKLMTGDELWPTIAKTSKAASSTRAAISYFTSDTYLHLHAGDILIADASDLAIEKGQTSAKTLSRLHSAGVRLFSCQNLHAKVLTCDSIAFVGSANASESSAHDLIEGVMMTSDTHAVAAANAFIEQIKFQSVPIDSLFIERVLSIKVLPRDPYTGPRRKKIDVSGERTWLVNVTVYGDEAFASEEADVEEAIDDLSKKSPELEGIDWTRWTGKTRFRELVRPADAMIVISMEHGDDSQPREVLPPNTILHRQDKGIWTRLYQCDDLAGNLQALTWRKFLNLWKKAGLKGKPTPNSMREILREEAEALKSFWPVAK